MTTQETILAYDFAKLQFSAVYIGRVNKPDWGDVFAWRVTIRNKGKEYSTDYFCGLAHVTKTNSAIGRDVIYDPKKKAHFKPKAPTVKDVMHSLTLDMQAIEQSFYDWCAELGFDSDSRKALSTYDQCCQAGQALRGMFTSAEIDAMREALQDY